MQDFRRGRHSVSLLTVHLVCVTKYRRRIFDSAALNWLAEHFRKVCETVDCRLIASDGEADHVHMLVEYPPKVSVSALVNILKGTSSRMLRQAQPDIARRYYKGILALKGGVSGAENLDEEEDIEAQTQRYTD